MYLCVGCNRRPKRFTEQKYFQVSNHLMDSLGVYVEQSWVDSIFRDTIYHLVVVDKKDSSNWYQVEIDNGVVYYKTKNNFELNVSDSFCKGTSIKVMKPIAKNTSVLLAKIIVPIKKR